LLQHAIIMTHVDGHESSEESAVLRELATRLGVDAAEAEALFSAARKRARRLRHLKG
jgi:protein-disulfide isomerase-like protein with CxxC motif